MRELFFLSSSKSIARIPCVRNTVTKNLISICGKQKVITGNSFREDIFPVATWNTSVLVNKSKLHLLVFFFSKCRAERLRILHTQILQMYYLIPFLLQGKIPLQLQMCLKRGKKTCQAFPHNTSRHPKYLFQLWLTLLFQREGGSPTVFKVNVSH